MCRLPGDPQTLFIQERPLAALRGEQLLIGGIVDDAGHDHAVALQCDRNGELRNAVQEVGGAVERVHDPAMGFVVTVPAATLLAQERIAGPRLGELREQDFFGAPIGRGDEIGRSLQGHLQVFDLSEVALEASAGLAGRGGHDIEQCGAEHESVFSRIGQVKSSVAPERWARRRA